MTKLCARAELYFRAHCLATLPLHAAMVKEICSGSQVPLELATVLEDIGQGYMAMAAQINEALIAQGRLQDEPDYEDGIEARTDAFVADLLGRAGEIRLSDGSVIDGGGALRDAPVALDAIRMAVLMARRPAGGPVEA